MGVLDQSEESLSTRRQSSTWIETIRSSRPRESRREEERQISSGRNSRSLRNRSSEGINTLTDIRRKTNLSLRTSFHLFKDRRNGIGERLRLRWVQRLSREVPTVSLRLVDSEPSTRFLFRYKGKGASRSDEMGDEKRIYAKFKVRLDETDEGGIPRIFLGQISYSRSCQRSFEIGFSFFERSGSLRSIRPTFSNPKSQRSVTSI